MGVRAERDLGCEAWRGGSVLVFVLGNMGRFPRLADIIHMDLDDLRLQMDISTTRKCDTYRDFVIMFGRVDCQ